MTKNPSSKSTVKNDAKGAMAPSQADSQNDGVHSAKPGGDRDATRKPDDHSSRRQSATDKQISPKDGST